MGIGKDLRPIKNRVVQGNGEDGETESPRPSQKFVRRIIQFILRIIEGVNMEIELDPIASLFSARDPFRIHGWDQFARNLDIPSLKQISINPMTENELPNTKISMKARTEPCTASRRRHEP